MRSTVKVAVLLAIASLALPTHLAAQKYLGPCSEDELADFRGFAETVKDHLRRGDPPPPMRSLGDCDPEGRLHEPLGKSFSDLIAQALKEKNVRDLELMADVLEKVRTSYQEGSHPGDYFKLSTEILNQLGRADDSQWLPEHPKNTRQVRNEFSALDRLTSYLKLKAKQIEDEAPSGGTSTGGTSTGGTRPRGTDPGEPSPSVMRAREPSTWNPGLVFGLSLASVLAVLVPVTIFMRRRRRWTPIYTGSEMRRSKERPPYPAPPAPPQAPRRLSGEEHPPPPQQPVARGADTLVRELRRRVEDLEKKIPSADEIPAGVQERFEDVTAHLQRIESRLTEPSSAPEEWPQTANDFAALRKRMENLEDLVMADQVPPQVEEHLKRLTERLDRIEGSFRELTSTSKWQIVNNKLKALEAQVWNLETQVGGLVESLEAQRLSLAESTGQAQRELAASAPEARQGRSALEELLVTEQGLLRDGWQRLQTTSQELCELVESFGDDTEHQVLQGLLSELPRAVDSDEELRQAFALRLAWLRTYNRRVMQLGLVRKLTERELPKDPEEQRKFLLMIRDSVHLLSALRNTDLESEILGFEPSRWCAEGLREVADLFFRFYQTAQAEGHEEGLEKPRELVVRALRIGHLEPIEIVLGKTAFDSSVHRGLSFAGDPRYANGTILEVLSNGFSSRHDGRVVAQPEVIVNRT